MSPPNPPRDRFTLLHRYKLLILATADPRLSRADIGTLAQLLEHVNEQGRCYPGMTRLADRAGLPRRTIVRSIQRLEASNYITVQRRSLGAPNVYTANFGLLELSPAVDGDVDDTSDTDDTTPVVTPETRTRDISDRPSDTGGTSVVAPMSPELASGTLSEGNHGGTKSESTRAQAIPDDELPDWLPAGAWARWCDYRGRAFDHVQQDASIRSLAPLVEQGHDPERVINLAIASGWKSFNGRPSTLAAGSGQAPSKQMQGALGFLGLSAVERVRDANARAGFPDDPGSRPSRQMTAIRRVLVVPAEEQGEEGGRSSSPRDAHQLALEHMAGLGSADAKKALDRLDDEDA